MTTKINLQSWANKSIQVLTHSETPALEVQVIMAFVLGQSREWIVTHSKTELTDEQEKKLERALLRLQNGEPLAYITGKRSFYGLEFIVSPEVLIPRPETEHLVEEAISWLEDNPSRRKVLDVGTGSGILAITLADTFSDLEITGIDISEGALEIAHQNGLLHHLDERISWLQNDLLAGINKKVDMIVANLPYIPASTLETLEVIHYEPRLALDGGKDGVDLIKRLLEQTTALLKSNGLILLEIEATISELVQEIARNIYPSAKITCLFDYANLPRLIKIQL